MHSTELEKWQKQSQQLSDKVLTLHKEVMQKEEELVETRKVLSQELELLNAEMADKQKIQNILPEKEMINWRIVNKLEKDNEMYKAELDNAKDLIKQGQRNVFTTGPTKLDPKDYAIKCVGGQ